MNFCQNTVFTLFAKKTNPALHIAFRCLFKFHLS